MNYDRTLSGGAGPAVNGTLPGKFVNSTLLWHLLLPVLAYLLGSIPCGLLLARRFARVDLRRSGSGNIGATNAARLGGPVLGLATLAADIGKAFLPVWAASVWTGSPVVPVAAAVAAVLGHTYPLYTRFHGGKGVATTAGGFLGIAPPAVLFAAAAFLVCGGIFRRASVGSLAAALLLPFAVHAAAGSWTVTTGAALASALIFIRHAENIRRLVAGTEPVFRFGRHR